MKISLKTHYKLLDALHSVFWYQGLLEQENDEWIDFKFKDNKGSMQTFSRPKYSKDSIILKLIDELRNKKTQFNGMYCHSDIEELCPDFCIGTEYNVIWIMLVEMFGSCGTSPRTGWIENRDGCANFLELIVEIEEKSLDLVESEAGVDE